MSLKLRCDSNGSVVVCLKGEAFCDELSEEVCIKDAKTNVKL